MNDLFIPDEIKNKIKTIHSTLSYLNEQLEDLRNSGINTNINVNVVHENGLAVEQMRRVVQASHFIIIPQTMLRDEILSDGE